MFKFIKEFFQLTNTEMKGAYVLLFLILAIFIAPRVYFKYQKTEVIEDLAFSNWIAEIERNDSLASLAKQNVQKESKEIELFPFNPNTVSFQEMLKLGIDKKTANILLKFRDKGAKFYSKKDLLKVYGFSEELYSKLESNIIFPEKQNKKYPKEYDNKKEEEQVVEKFPFDPNTVSKEEMLSLGIDAKTASILLKFRNKGAKFYSKEDILKVYGFSEELYLSIEEYILFPEKPSFENNDKYEKQTEEIPTLFLVDINKGDTADFKKLRGIGTYYAGNIIYYRNKLGGFYSLEQLKEVNGITEPLFNSLDANLELNNPMTRKIDINKAEFKELIKHPYIDKKLTLAILDLRKDIGGFLKIEDLLTYNTLSQEQFEKLKHYLEVKVD